MTDRKLLEQALEFVTSERWGTTPYMDVCVYKDAARLRDALRERLAQPEQEPVVYVCWSNPKNADGTSADIRMWLSGKPEGYGHQRLTTPQSKREWQGLTDEEISEISKSAN